MKRVLGKEGSTLLGLLAASLLIAFVVLLTATGIRNSIALNKTIETKDFPSEVTQLIDGFLALDVGSYLGALTDTDCDDDVYELVSRNVSESAYALGGVVLSPIVSSVDNPIFPCPEHEAFSSHSRQIQMCIFVYPLVGAASRAPSVLRVQVPPVSAYAIATLEFRNMVTGESLTCREFVSGNYTARGAYIHYSFHWHRLDRNRRPVLLTLQRFRYASME